MLYGLFCGVLALAHAGCNQSISPPAGTAVGSPAAVDGNTVSLNGFNLTFSDEWFLSPSTPGNPARVAIFGRSPEEQAANGIMLAAVSPQAPPGLSAQDFLAALTKHYESNTSKLEKETELEVSGAKGRFQLIRIISDVQTPGTPPDNTMHFKWTFIAGEKIVQISAPCPASKADVFAPKFEEVVKTLTFQ